MCVHVSLCVCVCVSFGCGCSGRTEEVSDPQLKALMSLLAWGWEMNSGPLEEQEVLLTTEPSTPVQNNYVFDFFFLQAVLRIEPRALYMPLCH